VRVLANIFAHIPTDAGVNIRRGNSTPCGNGCFRRLHRLLPERTKIRHDGQSLGLALAQRIQIVADRFFRVEPDLACVGANETFVENAAGKLVEALVFQRLQHAGADLGGIGDGVERYPPLLALLAKFFSELAHVCSGGRRLVCARALSSTIIG